MKSLFLSLLAYFWSVLAFAAITYTTPYAEQVGPTQLRQVRVNLERYKPTDRIVESSEIDFGDGTVLENQEDALHTYAADQNYNLVIKTWDRLNQVTVYNQVMNINSGYLTQDLANTTILSGVASVSQASYDLNITSTQATKLYKITVSKNPVPSAPLNRYCDIAYNFTMNNMNMFADGELNCDMLKAEKFVRLQPENVYRLIGTQLRWNVRFNIEIHAVEVVNPDVIAPVINSNLSSGGLTRSPNVHISVNDASSVQTYVWDGNQNLLNTLSVKEFDLPLSEGANSFVLKSVDSSGNQSSYYYITNLVLDSTPPALNVILQSQYIYNTYPQTFNLQINANENLDALTVNNYTATMLSPGIYTYALVVSAPGPVTLNLKAFDLAGNELIQDYNVTFGLDNVAPVLSSSLANNSFTKLNNLNISVVDNADTISEVYRDGVLLQSTALKSFNIPLIEGLNNLVVKSTDQYGNQAQNLALNITYDTHSPELVTDLGDINYFKTLPAEVDIGFGSNEVLQSFEVDGVVIPLTGVDPEYGQVYSFSKTVTQASGNQIVVKATDLAGNVTTETYPINIQLDNVIPVITLGTFQNPTIAGGLVIPVNVFDTSPTITEVRVNGALLASGINLKVFNYTAVLPNFASYNIEFRTTDAAGNVGIRTAVIVRKPDITPPVLTLNNSVFVVPSLPANITVQVNSNEVLKTLVAGGVNVPVSVGTVNSYVKNITALNGNVLNIVGTDLYDNSRTFSFPITMIVDNQPPVINPISLPALTSATSIMLPVDITDLTGVRSQIEVNGVLLSTVFLKNYTYNIDLPTDRLYIIKITATDDAGNVSVQNLNVTRRLDMIAPVITPAFPNIFVNGFPRTVDLTFTSNENLQFLKVDGNIVGSNNLTYHYQKVLTGPDNQSVNVDALDLSGNLSVNTFPITITLDTTAPVITLGSYSDFTSSEWFLLPVNISDANDTRTQVFLDGTLLDIINEKVFSYNMPLSYDGVHTIMLVTVDIAGNSANTVFNITKDARPLDIQIQSPLASQTFHTLLLPIAFTSNKPIQKAYVAGVEVPVNPDHLTVSYNYLAWNPGPFSVTVRVEDIYGASQEKTVTGQITISEPGWTYEECPVQE